MHNSVTACCACFSLGWWIFTDCCESPPQWAKRNWLMLRGDSSYLLPVLQTETAEWSALSDLHSVILTLMLTVKSPALLPLWICLLKSVEAKHTSPICIACSDLPTISIHFCSSIHLELPKKLQPPLLKFSMFHFWPKVSLDFLKSQRKIPLAACELKWSAKTKKHFPPFETASSHISLGSETPTIQHKGAAYKPY